MIACRSLAGPNGNMVVARFGGSATRGLCLTPLVVRRFTATLGCKHQLRPSQIRIPRSFAIASTASDTDLRPGTSSPLALQDIPSHVPQATVLPAPQVIVQNTPEVLQASANYENVVSIGAYKAKQPAAKIFVLGIMAGCHIAFGAFLMLAIGGNMPGMATSNYGLYKLITALVFPVGLLMVLLGGAELYTGNTFTVACACLEGKISLAELAKSWLCSYSGNLVGSLLMVTAVVHSGLMPTNAAAVSMATYKTSHSLGPVLIRAVLANWLVCIAVFQAYAASSLAGKVWGIWGPITGFVAIGLEHSVANMFIIPLGIMLGANISVADFFLKNLIPVTIGNTFAGVACMALVYSFAYGKIGKQIFKASSKH